jgi:hypothetical protein
VLVQPHVPLRDERVLTVQALMDCGPALDYPATDSAGG